MWNVVQLRAFLVEGMRHPPEVFTTVLDFSAKPWLLAKQAFQVWVGNVMLQKVLELMQALLFSGGCGVIEHPAEPQEDW